jgi:mRNA interferase MazF
MEMTLLTASSVQRGQIWRVNLNPTQGDEISKIRPCIVLSGAAAGRLNLRIVVPVTDWKEAYQGYFWMTRLEPDEQNGLNKTSAADAFQVRSVSLTRFVSQVGVTTDERVERIVKAVALCLR